MLPDHLRVFYLHGFASGVRSRKAQFFAEKLSAAGVRVEVPVLDQGNFQALTITGQLQVIDQAVQGESAVLIGSSLGGYLAALYAARRPQIQRAVLLAPAFRFHDLWTSGADAADLARWRQVGSVPVFHYGEGRQMPLGYQLIEDAAQYEPWPDFAQPALILHGTRDRHVPFEYSAEFVRNHPNARLVPMNSGHELTDVLDEIWKGSRAFLFGADWADEPGSEC